MLWCSFKEMCSSTGNQVVNSFPWDSGALGADGQAKAKISFSAGVPGWLRVLSGRLLISAQVTILQSVSSSPMSGSMPTVCSRLGILSPSLSAHPQLVCSRSPNK